MHACCVQEWPFDIRSSLSVQLCPVLFGFLIVYFQAEIKDMEVRLASKLPDHERDRLTVSISESSQHVAALA